MIIDINLNDVTEEKVKIEALIVIEKKVLNNNLSRRFAQFAPTKATIAILEESEETIKTIDELFKNNLIQSVIYIGSNNDILPTDHITISQQSISTSTTHKTIGFQRHLSSGLHHPILSIGLGELKKDIMQSELILRNTKATQVQLSVLKANETYRNKTDSAHGISSEEFCQLLKICGFSCVDNIIWFSDVSQDPSINELDILCSSIWYYLEGLSLRQNEDPNDKSHMTTLMVQASDLSEDHEFIKSKETGRLWYKRSNANDNDQYVACSLEDYQATCEEGIPERLVFN